MATPIDIPETHADLIANPTAGVLTTLNPDGYPQSTGVWFMVDDDGVLKVSITTDRQKYRNLRRDPKATLFVFDPGTPYRTVEVRSTVELAPDPDRVLLPKLADRYNVPVEVVDDPSSERVMVLLDPVRVVTYG